MDTLGALAMSTEYPDDRYFLQKPRGKHDKVLTVGMIWYTISESIWQLGVQFFLMFYG
jgi:hypothetical protein